MKYNYTRGEWGGCISLVLTYIHPQPGVTPACACCTPSSTSPLPSPAPPSSSPAPRVPLQPSPLHSSASAN